MKPENAKSPEVTTTVFKAAAAAGILAGLAGSVYGVVTGALLKASLSLLQTIFMCVMAFGPRIERQRGNIMLAVGIVAVILTWWMIVSDR